MTNLNSNSKDWLIWRQAIGGGLRLYFAKGINTPVAGGIENGNNIKFLTVSQGGVANINSTSGVNGAGVSCAAYGFSTPTGPIDIHASPSNDYSNPVYKSNAAASYLTFPICASQLGTSTAGGTNYGTAGVGLSNSQATFSRKFSGGFSSSGGSATGEFNNNNTWRNNILTSVISKINPNIAPSISGISGFWSNESVTLNAVESSSVSDGKNQMYNINDYNSNFNVDPINHFSFEFFISKEYFNDYINDMRSSVSIMHSLVEPVTISSANLSSCFNPNRDTQTTAKYTKSIFNESGTGKFQFPFMSFVFINTNAKVQTADSNSNTSFYHLNQPFTKHFIGAVNTVDNATPNDQSKNPPSEFDIFSFPADMIKNVEMSIIRIKR